MKGLLKCSVAALVVMAPMAAAHGAAMLREADGGGFGTLAMPRNDDGSSNELVMPFEIDFYGQMFDSFYVNNNGNITFDSPLSSFTPFNFGSLGQAMIAPYWADVDTRCVTCGEVYVGSFAPGQFSVTWDNVGYFSRHDNKLNSFQVTLFQVGDEGDFDIEFRYNKLEWTTGDASEGINGLGGIPAAAGFTNGDGVTELQPGSFLSPGALNMANESNVDEDGIWVYNIRNDMVPDGYGTTPDNPILPTGRAGEDGYVFDFEVEFTDVTYFIDPPVATGYDYSVVGSMFTSAQFTSALVDLDGYELWDGGTFLGTVAIGDIFTFASPLSSFELRGINPANLLTPGDPLAFVSGFTFNSVGLVSVTQIPFVEDYVAPTPRSPVPEPATWALMMLGMFGIGGAMRGRKVRTSVSFA